MLTEGFHKISDSYYFAIDALNYSTLKHFNKSAAHVLEEKNRTVDTSTAAMREGTGYHWRMLQPELFNEMVTPDHPDNKNSNHYKEWRDRRLYEGKLILPGKTIENIDKAAEKARLKNSVMQFLQAGWPEKTLIWYDQEFNLWMKAKLDWICADGRTICDLKKARNASEYGFRRAIYNYEYYGQAFHYLRGYEQLTGRKRTSWVWIVTEIDPPHESQVFMADPHEIDRAGDTVCEYYDRYAKCIETGEWPGYPDQVIEFGYRFDSEDDINDLPF